MKRLTIVLDEAVQLIFLYIFNQFINNNYVTSFLLDTVCNNIMIKIISTGEMCIILYNFVLYNYLYNLKRKEKKEIIFQIIVLSESVFC